MAKEDAVRFLTEAEDDEALRRELAEARLESIRWVAQKHGVTFSLEDLRAAVEEHAAQLSREELDAVAGGLLSPYPTASRVASY